MNARHISAIAAVVALGLSAPALAGPTGKRVGSFTAMGTGTVAAQGNMTAAFGKIKGSIVVRDRVGEAVVKVRGVAQTPRLVTSDGRTIRVFTIPRAKGTFFIKGANVRITLASGANAISVTMIGRGKVTRLSGDGTYSVNDENSLNWADAVPPIPIAPPPAGSVRTTQALQAAAALS